MSWWAILLLELLGLLVIMFAGMPIFVAFLIMNVVGVLVLIGPIGFGMFANSMYTTTTTADLAAVPLFIVMGELLFKSGAIDVVIDSLDRLVGKVRGRQYYLCILLSAICGALSGAAMAVAGLLGRSLFPTMEARGYDRKLSIGTIMGGASLDPIIPPSVAAIIIASIAKISTGKLLIAGFIPGILLTLVFLAYVYIRVRLNPKLSPDISSELDEGKQRGSAIMAIIRMLPVSIIFFMVVGFIMLGIATPTEAAATGVVGAVLLAACYGGLSLATIGQALDAGIRVTGIMLAIIACAAMFSQLLVFSGALQELGNFSMHLNLGPYQMLFVMLAVPFILFMFLDQTSVLLVLIPIYLPIVKQFGFDSIWFWTLMLIVAVIGGISPPFGYTLFAFKSAAPTVPTKVVFSAAWPFVWLIVLGLVILIAFPSLVTVLPNLTRM